MSHFDTHDRSYESDDSTLVDEDRYGRRSRRSSAYHSRSEESASPRRAQNPDSERDGLGKTALAAGLIAALAGLFHIWNVRRREEREREERHRRRAKFAKAKSARRRDEERRERQRQRDDEHETPSELLRIGNAPTQREQSRRPRMIEGGSYDAGRRRSGSRRYQEGGRSGRER
ncbi:hypothetical protein LTR53_005365 [Teratosphaeriaceae sp. CCFEE 6253]|nr:hypothetical protein LTR53_005365 [Teratosphaeriaceae sp. CCFEE 6253]